MNAKAEAADFQLDGLKWLVVVALVIGGAVANTLYAAEFPILYRVIGLLILGIAACFVAVKTAKGNAFWELLKASQVEIRKVVWPTSQETIQTTLVVVVVVIIAAVILWGLDSLFGFIASKIIG
ncbi:Protein translocase subunit SecE [Thalassocella blandensis]|nr:Protein translocase subunit SecE [Thalassocella blandensis]